MSHCSFKPLHILLFVLGCHGLKLSPPGSPVKWYKRQASTDTSAPSTTTISAPNSLVPSGASTCVCRLAQPFNQYVTFTSTYAATGSADGLSTTTLAQASGTTPGTVEVLTPLSYATITVTSGTQPVYTSTITTYLPGGPTTTYVVVNEPELSTSTVTSGSSSTFTSTTFTTLSDGSTTSYVIVDYPVLSTVTQYSGSVTTTNTVATTDATGGSTTVVVVDVPPSSTTVTSGSVGYTSTVTTTDANGSPSPIVVVDVPALCGNQGWQWAYAHIPAVDHGFTNDFDYSSLQTASYSFAGGTTSYIGLNPGSAAGNGNDQFAGPNISYYGQYTASEGEAALNHRAFFIPPLTGIYTFGITQADDEAAMYLGDAALRGYNNNNQLVETSYGGGSKSVQRTLNQYSCNPIRLLWADGSTPGSFNITITGPDGTQLDDGDYVRDTCCGDPYTFSSFGNEA